MTTRIKRVAVPFLWRAADGLGANGKLIARSYGKELDGVFTRAGQAAVFDTNGVRRIVAHSVPALGVRTGEAVLDLTPGATNICLQSEDFGTTWSVVGTPTRTPAAHTSLGISLDLIGDDDAAAQEGYQQTIAFTGDGAKCISIFLKAGTSPVTTINLADTTVPATRALVKVTWTGGVPSLSNEFGSATLFTPELYSDGVYRIAFSPPGVVAANTNLLIIYAARDNSVTTTGTVYAGGVQVENAAIPGPYVKTTTASATHAADSLYFPLLLTPRELTVYVRQVNVWNFSSGGGSHSRFCHIGAANVATRPYLSCYANATSGAAGTQYDDGTSVASSGEPDPSAIFGDIVETRGVLTSDWRTLTGVAKNGGAETVGALSAVTAAATAAWGGQRIYLAALSTQTPHSALTHVVVALGTKTMAEMRALAEVG